MPINNTNSSVYGLSKKELLIIGGTTTGVITACYAGYKLLKRFLLVDF